MAEISKITLPNGNTYDLKDSVARGNALPSGGTNGQVIVKTSDGPAWENELAPKVQFTADSQTSTTDDYIMNVTRNNVATGIVQLATVATSGDYSDLANKPAFVVQQQASSNKYEAAFSSTVPYSTNQNLVNLIYPVGSIYMSMVNTNPQVLFGFGTWTQIQDTFLLAAGTNHSAGTSGGEETHTLTEAEMPSHDHGSYYTGHASTKNYGWRSDTGDKMGYAYIPVGGNQPHNNMPPYLTVYMWQRTA